MFLPNILKGICIVLWMFCNIMGLFLLVISTLDLTFIFDWFSYIKLCPSRAPFGINGRVLLARALKARNRNVPSFTSDVNNHTQRMHGTLLFNLQLFLHLTPHIKPLIFINRTSGSCFWLPRTNLLSKGLYISLTSGYVLLTALKQHY